MTAACVQDMLTRLPGTETDPARATSCVPYGRTDVEGPREQRGGRSSEHTAKCRQATALCCFCYWHFAPGAARFGCSIPPAQPRRAARIAKSRLGVLRPRAQDRHARRGVRVTGQQRRSSGTMCFFAGPTIARFPSARASVRTRKASTAPCAGRGARTGDPRPARRRTRD